MRRSSRTTSDVCLHGADMKLPIWSTVIGRPDVGVLAGRAGGAPAPAAERLPGLRAVAETRPPKGASMQTCDGAAGLLWTARRITGKAISRLPAGPEWDSTSAGGWSRQVTPPVPHRRTGTCSSHLAVQLLAGRARRNGGDAED